MEKMLHPLYDVDFEMEKEEMKAWFDAQMKRWMRTARAVFAGPRHMLILLRNGDLYALGSNRSGACGEDLPDYLDKPVCIAHDVRHAAAGAYHTLYVKNDGSVGIIGNSEYADRFKCDIRARRVFTGDAINRFWIEDTEGKLYYFGENQFNRFVKPRVLCDLPPMTLEGKREWRWHRYGTYGEGCVSLMDGIDERSLEYSDEFQEKCDEIQREEWYREYARQYGEANLKIKAGEGSVKVLCSEDVCEYDINQYGKKNGVYKRDIAKYTYPVQLILEYEEIYEPMEIEGRIGEERNLCVYNCQLDAAFDDLPEEVAAHAEDFVKVVAIKRAPFSHYYGCIDRQNCLRILEKGWRSTDYALPGIVDMAVSNGDVRDTQQILLINEQGEVLHGSMKELFHTGSWDHLKKLNF